MYDFIFEQKGKDGYYKIWHTPEQNIFLFVRAGEGSIVLREMNYPLAPGVLCFIGKNKYHYTFPKQPGGYVRSKLLLDSSDMSKLLQLLNGAVDIGALFGENSFTAAVLFGNDLETVSSIFEELNRREPDSRYASAEVCIAAARLMLTLAKNAAVQTQTNPDPLQRAIGYINRHISEDLGVDSISEACYVSKYYLCRLFKKKIGVTIMEYVLQTRIAMAKELLEKQKLSVTEIGALCGFSSPSYFSRVFKEKTGSPPFEYRKRRS